MVALPNLQLHGIAEIQQMRLIVMRSVQLAQAEEAVGSAPLQIIQFI
jgi:hypothetical protein